MKWHTFDANKGSRQKRPPIKKYVLVALAPNTAIGQTAPCIVVGYRKDAAGDKQSPYFVTPSARQANGRNAIAWCDCLPDDFEWPRRFNVEVKP